jgi:hypothetical protein
MCGARLSELTVISVVAFVLLRPGMFRAFHLIS